MQNKEVKLFVKKRVLLFCFSFFTLFGCGRTEIQPQEVNVDTTAPIITLKETEFLEGTKVTADDLVNVSDVSETELFLYTNDREVSDVALKSAFVFLGDTFLVKAVDKYGNESLEEITPKIVRKTVEATGNEEEIDMENYLHKIWVLNQAPLYDYASTFTFVIDSVDQNEISGRIVVYRPYKIASKRDYRRTELDRNARGWNFVGSIQGDYAQCRFVNKNNQEGTLNIWFLDDGNIEAAVVYDDADLNVDIISRDLFSPYNTSDLDKNYHIEKTIKTNLDFWNDVHLISGEAQRKTDANRSIIFVYVTDADGNIFYRFEDQFLTEITDVCVEDLNGDGRRDIKFVENYEESGLGSLEEVFIQMDEGVYKWHRQFSKEG